MKLAAPIQDMTAQHRGFRSPAYRVIGEFAAGVNPELLGVRRSHAEARTLAEKRARRSPYHQIVIQ